MGKVQLSPVCLDQLLAPVCGVVCFHLFSRVSSFKVFRCSAVRICKGSEVLTAVNIDMITHCSTESY